MRVCCRFLGSALLIGMASFAQVRAEEYSLTFLFGPGSAATARQGAHRRLGLPLSARLRSAAHPATNTYAFAPALLR